MKRIAIAAAVAVACIAAIVTAIVISSGGEKTAQAEPLELCAPLYSPTDARALIECIADKVNGRLAADPNPARVMPLVDKEVGTEPGPLFDVCHVAMHLTGAKFVRDKGITLATMQRYMPASDSTNCSAGFTHGMISSMGVTPQKAKQMASGVCAREPSRARQFACIHGIGHGLRRFFGDPKPALKFCSSLASRSATSDCAQGVYHDYFLAAPAQPSPQALKRPLKDKPVTMSDLVGQARERERSSPLDRLCLDQPTSFLRECWYRLATGPGIPVTVGRPSDILYACGGLPGKHRSPCIAAIATARVEPEKLVESCAPLARKSPADGADCMNSINLQSVGWDPPGGAERYWSKTIPDILAKCSSQMPAGQPRRVCITRVAQFSFRSIPLSISQSEATRACRRLAGADLALCRQVVDASWREGSRIKL